MAASAKKVYVPGDLNVQFGPTKEHPDGRVVTLKQGLVELDDDLAAHPVIAQLATQSPTEAARAERLQKAAAARDEAVGKAQAAYFEEVAACDKEATEETAKLTEEWSQRAAAAAEKGEGFNEPHPDKATAAAINLTRGVGPVSVGGAQARTSEDTANLPSEHEEEAGSSGTGRHRGRPRLEQEPAP